MKIIPLNTDKDGNCSCLKAGYYKMGGANFIGHTKDGFKATCVMETIERDTPMKGNYTEPRICTMVGRDPNNPSSRARSDHYEQFLEMGDDVSNTLTSVQKDNLVAEPNVLTPKRTDFGKQVRKQYESGGQTSPTLTAGGEAPSYYEGETGGNYRIRKLTPRECFRLMGVTEADIDKIQQSGVSQSQQYKMAGNSIVVDVLYHIFRKLFVITGQESQQLSLF